MKLYSSDKAWHENLFYKLKQNGVSGNLLNIITDFLSLRKQKVVMIGQHSTWVNIEEGVLQGFFPGPLLFLIYINELSDDSTHDASLFYVLQDINSTTTYLNSDLSKVSD